MKKVWLAIPVKFPDDVDIDPRELTDYLNKFVDVGLSDLTDSVEDENIDRDKSDEIVANKTQWGHPLVLEEFWK